MAFKLRLVLTGAAIASIYLTSLGSLRAAEGPWCGGTAAIAPKACRAAPTIKAPLLRLP